MYKDTNILSKQLKDTSTNIEHFLKLVTQEVILPHRRALR